MRRTALYSLIYALTALIGTASAQDVTLVPDINTLASEPFYDLDPDDMPSGHFLDRAIWIGGDREALTIAGLAEGKPLTGGEYEDVYAALASSAVSREALDALEAVLQAERYERVVEGSTL